MAIKIDTIDTVEDFENQFKRTQTDNTIPWPTRLSKDANRLSVRFLTVPEGVWINYTQYFDPATKRGIIASEENEQGLIDRGLNPSRRWLAPAINRENNEVIVVELNWTLLEAINALREEYGEKLGDLTQFDIALKRSGQGKDDTKYFAFLEGTDKVDVTDTNRFPIPGDLKTWRDLLWAVAEKLIDFQEGRNSKSNADVLADDTNEETASEAPRVVRRKG